MAKLVHVGFKGSQGTSVLGLLGCSMSGIRLRTTLFPAPWHHQQGPLPLSIEPLREESWPRRTSWVNVAFLLTPW